MIICGPVYVLHYQCVFVIENNVHNGLLSVGAAVSDFCSPHCVLI